MPGWVRAFLIALAAPLVPILRAVSMRPAASRCTQTVSPRLVHDFPVYLFAGPGYRAAVTHP